MRYWNFGIIFGLCFLGAGCTAPHKFVLDYARVDSREMQKPLRVAWVGMDPSAGINKAVMTSNAGRFSKQDLQVIEKSLRDTFATLNVDYARGAPLNIHVYVHRYILVYSNMEGSGMAIVGWCMESEGNLLAEGIFYSLNKGHTMASIRASKDRINKTLVRYITETALSKALPNYKPMPVIGAFTDADKAIATMPETVRGTLIGGLISFAIGGEIRVDTDYKKNSTIIPVDWEEHLREFYVAVKK